ncbi:MAG TPA: MerR family DNA-binding transcriptional regulator [Caulobacteraceae bacterium]|nr:MerR family DNA-binding transcriptional regulator [Caulobacteraceae bacterium]
MADSKRTYTIRQLCNEFGVTPRALRFYEDKGLLSPERRGLNRVYANRDHGRLQLILRGKRVGLALSEIRDLLDLYDLPDGGVSQAASSLRKFRERIVALEQQRLDIETALTQLRATVTALETHLATVRPDLLPRAGDYEQVLRAGLNEHPAAAE